MAKLIGLFKTIIGAAIFRKAIKGAFTIALMKSLSWITRPETISMLGKHAAGLLKSKPAGNSPGILQTILKGLLALHAFKNDEKELDRRARRDLDHRGALAGHDEAKRSPAGFSSECTRIWRSPGPGN